MYSKNENNKQQQKQANKQTKAHHENTAQYPEILTGKLTLIPLLLERLVTDHIAISMKELSG